MTKSEAIRKFRDGEITLYLNGRTSKYILLLAEILITAKPKKELPNTLDGLDDRLVDRFYWSSKESDRWLGRPYDGSGLEVVKISKIDEEKEILSHGINLDFSTISEDDFRDFLRKEHLTAKWEEYLKSKR